MNGPGMDLPADDAGKNSKNESAMTQILLYQCAQGIALATDSKAVTFLPDERKSSLEVRKIFVLSPYVILVTAGAGYGILLCHQFQSFVKSRGFSKLAEIIDLARTFLPEQIAEVYQEKLYRSDRTELDRVYFIFAGYNPDQPGNLFRFEIMGSENSGDPLHTVQTAHAVAIPRKMGIEYKLSHLTPGVHELDDALALCESFLIRLCRETSEVGPPLHFVRITEAGINIQTRDSVT